MRNRNARSTRRTATACVAAVALAVSAAACSESAGADNELRYSSPLGPESFQDSMLKPFFEDIEEQTDGAVKVTTFYGGSLIQAPDSAAAVSDGRVDLALGSPQYYPAELPISSVTELPFVTSNGAALSLAMRDAYEENDDLRKEWQAMGLEILVFAPTGSNTLNSKTPITGPDGLDGTKLRAVGLTAEAVEKEGARPNAIQIGEVYESLQRGNVDAVTSISAEIAVDLGVYETAKHAQDFGFGEYTTSPIFMNKEWWDNLDSDAKAGIEKARDNFYASLAESIEAQQDRACERLDEAGVELSVWSDAEQDAFATSAGDPIVESWASEHSTDGFDATAFLERHRELVGQYEESDPSQSTIAHCAGE